MLLHMDAMILEQPPAYGSGIPQSGNGCSTVLCNKDDVLIAYFDIWSDGLYAMIFTGRHWPHWRCFPRGSKPLLHSSCSYYWHGRIGKGSRGEVLFSVLRWTFARILHERQFTRIRLHHKRSRTSSRSARQNTWVLHSLTSVPFPSKSVIVSGRFGRTADILNQLDPVHSF